MEREAAGPAGEGRVPPGALGVAGLRVACARAALAQAPGSSRSARRGSRSYALGQAGLLQVHETYYASAKGLDQALELLESKRPGWESRKKHMQEDGCALPSSCVHRADEKLTPPVRAQTRRTRRARASACWR